MGYIKMKYKGFELNVNPKTFKMIAQKDFAKTTIPNGYEINKELGKKALVVKGEGSFVGIDSMEKAHLLLELFNKKGSDFLFLPSGDVTKMNFTKLEIKYSSASEKVDYAFEFLEDIEGKDTEYTFGYTYAKRQENLFDIANRTGVEIEKLASINTLESIYAVSEGDKVWLM